MGNEVMATFEGTITDKEDHGTGKK